MYAKHFIKIFGILFISLIAGLFVYSNYTADKGLSSVLTNVMFIRFSLLAYAQKHGGAFPAGNSSTEIFQKLIDDHDLKANYVYFDLPGKTQYLEGALNPNNVCYDFTQGTDSTSPDWVPIVLPTGFQIDYASGEAKVLESNGVRDNVFNAGYVDDIRTWRLNLLPMLPIKKQQIYIMPGKPTSPDVARYRQLTPSGRF